MVGKISSDVHDNTPDSALLAEDLLDILRGFAAGTSKIQSGAAWVVSLRKKLMQDKSIFASYFPGKKRKKLRLLRKSAHYCKLLRL